MKCHPESYHNDIEYPMTLNIIFRVVLRPSLKVLSIERTCNDILSLPAPEEFRLPAQFKVTCLIIEFYISSTFCYLCTLAFGVNSFYVDELCKNLSQFFFNF